MTKTKNVPTSQELALDQAQQQFDTFDAQVKDLTMDRMNQAPKEEKEPQTKLSQNEIAKSKDIYLKPHKIIGPGINPKTGEREKFNEKFRDDYEFAKEYVCFIAENNECVGETIDMWTKPFPGMNCEEWLVPTNKPIWAPRYVAEQIKRKSYHRLQMQESSRPDNAIGGDAIGAYYGKIVVDTTTQRLDARPANTKTKSIFMGE
jgi:hypothetical protein